MDFNEANDVFMTDPFLSLDNDLDDVSGKKNYESLYISIGQVKLLLHYQHSFFAY